MGGSCNSCNSSDLFVIRYYCQHCCNWRDRRRQRGCRNWRDRHRQCSSWRRNGGGDDSYLQLCWGWSPPSWCHWGRPWGVWRPKYEVEVVAGRFAIRHLHRGPLNRNESTIVSLAFWRMQHGRGGRTAACVRMTAFSWRRCCFFFGGQRVWPFLAGVPIPL